MIVQAREKCLHTATDHPKRLALQNDIPQCIFTRSSFRIKDTELSTIIPEELGHCQVVNLFPSPPIIIITHLFQFGFTKKVHKIINYIMTN